MNYQEGGAVRPGHAEDLERGPNPHDPKKSPRQYKLWESTYHKDPAPPPEEAPPPAEEEEGGIGAWLRSLFAEDPETANIARREAQLRELEEQGQARGGRVGYQAGGPVAFAPRITPPSGGVPPWVGPVGSGSGYQEEQGFQVGGLAAAGRMPYRGVLPQRAQLQGPTSLRGRGPTPVSRYRGTMGRGTPPGFRLPRRGPMGPLGGRRLPPGIDPRAVAANPQGYAQWQAERARRGMAGRGTPRVLGQGPFAAQDTFADRLGRAQRMATGQQTYADVVAEGGGGINPIVDPATGRRLMDRGPIATPPGGSEWTPGTGFPGGPPIPGTPRPGAPGTVVGRPLPGGGGAPDWKAAQMLRNRRQVPPMPGEYMGGPRVPPTQRGYLQRMRMMNRPPPMVGRGVNRVGQGDQQGALSRAMQRGTGRPPMSRRRGFYR